jgi:hypothetical protein
MKKFELLFESLMDELNNDRSLIIESLQGESTLSKMLYEALVGTITRMKNGLSSDQFYGMVLSMPEEKKKELLKDIQNHFKDIFKKALNKDVSLELRYIDTKWRDDLYGNHDYTHVVGLDEDTVTLKNKEDETRTYNLNKIVTVKPVGSKFSGDYYIYNICKTLMEQPELIQAAKAYNRNDEESRRVKVDIKKVENEIYEKIKDDKLLLALFEKYKEKIIEKLPERFNSFRNQSFSIKFEFSDAPESIKAELEKLIYPTEAARKAAEEYRKKYFEEDPEWRAHHAAPQNPNPNFIIRINFVHNSVDSVELELVEEKRDYIKNPGF